MVIMVDGVRLNENELASSVLSTIPIDTVERIEIVRGGSSVLYGEGATGGVIQIVTKDAGMRKNTTHGSVFAEAGQFRERDEAPRFGTWPGPSALMPPWRARTTTTTAITTTSRRTASAAACRWRYAGGRAGLRVESARQDSRLAGFADPGPVPGRSAPDQ
jgi:iron complex outermembrane receptor protein